MDQLRGKALNRETALEGDGIDTDGGMENGAASTAETWREQVLEDIVEGDGSIGQQDAIGPRGKQDNDYLDSSGSRSGADAHEDRSDTVEDSQGERDQDPSAGSSSPTMAPHENHRFVELLLMMHQLLHSPKEMSNTGV